MNKRLLLLSAFVIVMTLPVNAEITSSDTSSGEFLINSGYSETAAEMVERAKGYANATPYVTEEERDLEERPMWQQVLVKFYRYIDPAADSDQFQNHNIRKAPSYNDL